MTIKALADKLGVSKEKIKYLYRQLPEHMYVMVENRVILSDAAVDAIKNRLNGGELTSDIPVPPYNAVNPIGWGAKLADETSPEIGDSGEFASEFHQCASESDCQSGETIIELPFTSEFTGETRGKSGDGETGEKTSFSLTIFDHYKTMIEARDAQLTAKDEQINALYTQIDKLTTALTERDTAVQEVTERQINAIRADAAEQLTAKDSQIAEKDEQLKRMQDTIDALTRQLKAEQQSREARKWWQWWK